MSDLFSIEENIRHVSRLIYETQEEVARARANELARIEGILKRIETGIFVIMVCAIVITYKMF